MRLAYVTSLRRSMVDAVVTFAAAASAATCQLQTRLMPSDLGLVPTDLLQVRGHALLLAREEGDEDVLLRIERAEPALSIFCPRAMFGEPPRMCFDLGLTSGCIWEVFHRSQT